eukprot:gb/GECG01009190.1/.p1 GENE.gb/GECG01009190.1/~~gb/GECG01009190.1/.p1  ORF type:complete len:175 (+),score=9.30 gb/GECG01009190.1/:1-525(+)
MDEERQPLTEGDSGVDGTMRTHAHSMKRKVDFNRWPVYLKQACIALSIVAVVVFLLFPRGIESKQKPAVGAPSGQQQSLLRQGKFGEDGHGQKPSGTSLVVLDSRSLVDGDTFLFLCVCFPGIRQVLLAERNWGRALGRCCIIWPPILMLNPPKNAKSRYACEEVMHVLNVHTS